MPKPIDDRALAFFAPRLEALPGRPEAASAVGETRKLAAILVSDVVGYSRLTGADEDRILARLRALRSDLIDPTIAVHHGRSRQAHRRRRNCRVPQCRRRSELRH